MTLREWCQQQGHPFATQVMVLAATEGQLRPVGRACVCGKRHDPMPDGRGYRVMVPEAVDREGPDRTAP